MLVGFFIAALGVLLPAKPVAAQGVGPISIGGGNQQDVTCPSPYTYSQYEANCSTPLKNGKCPSNGTVNATFKDCWLNAKDEATAENGSATGTDDATTGCNADFTNPLTWVICPVIGIGEELVRRIDNFITSSLDFQTDTVFDTTSQTSRGYYVAWNSFRILATALLIIAGLFMITSHALGFEALDAYTIRKVMPRLLIAAIGISLSWPLMKFTIDFFNTLGVDIRNLIYSPFSYLSKDGTLGGSTILAGDAAIFGYLFVFGPGAILSLLATAALAVLVGFLVIIVRDLALIVLIVIAPVAIATYVLPNTQKVWKLWKDNFLGLLLVFPIISAFIAVGHVFSAVSLSSASGNGATGGGTAAQIVGFIAYFLPYFLLPVAFRLATGVIGTVAGFVNDRHRGAFDRLKAGRGNAAKARHASRMAGDGKVFGAGSKGIGSLYRRSAAVSTPGSGALSVTRRGRAAYTAYEQAHMAHRTAEMLKNDDGRAGGDDTAMKLASQDHMTRDEFIRRYQVEANNGTGATLKQAEAALALTEASFGAKIGTDSLKAAAWKSRAASVTGYDESDAGKQELFEDAGRMVRSGLMTDSDAMAAIKANSKRLDQSAISFGQGLSKVRKAAAGRGSSINQADVDALMDSAIEGITPGSFIGARKESMQSISRHVMRQLDSEVAAAGGDINDRKVKIKVAHIASMQDQVNAESPQMTEVFASGVMAQPIGTSGYRVRDYSDTLRSTGDDVYHDHRKEWQTGPGVPPPGYPGGPPTPGGPPPGPPPAAGGGGGGAGGGGGTSDIRLKRDISPLTTTENGIQLYRFKYLWSDQEYVGVMAQDLVESHPEALSKDEFGFYRVDYTKLDLRMMTIEEWDAEHTTVTVR